MVSSELSYELYLTSYKPIHFGHETQDFNGGVFMPSPGGKHLTGRRSVFGAKAPSQTYTACTL